MMLISPRSTLKSCGRASTLAYRRYGLSLVIWGGSVPTAVDIFNGMQRGAKTQRLKTPAADPDALLALKDGPRTLELDCDRNDGHQR
jgi:hypothetical protein